MSYTLQHIADLVSGRVVGDGQVLISDIILLAEAEEGEISFFVDRRYEQSLRSTRASALLVAAFTDLYAGPQVVVSRPALRSRPSGRAFFLSRPLLFRNQ